MIPAVCASTEHPVHLAESLVCTPLPTRISVLGGLPRAHLDAALVLGFSPWFPTEAELDDYLDGELEVRL